MTTKQKQKQAKKMRQAKNRPAPEKKFSNGIPIVNDGNINLYPCLAPTKVANGLAINMPLPEGIQALRNDICNIQVYLENDGDYPSYKYMTGYGYSFAAVKNMGTSDLKDYRQFVIGVPQPGTNKELAIGITLDQDPSELNVYMLTTLAYEILPKNVQKKFGSLKKTRVEIHETNVGVLAA
jgi:hypothetical protein